MLSDLAKAVRQDADGISENLESLRSTVTLLQIQVGASEDVDENIKQPLMSNLSRIWVALDALTLKFVGDGEKKEGIAGDLSGVISSILADAAQTKMPLEG